MYIFVSSQNVNEKKWWLEMTFQNNSLTTDWLSDKFLSDVMNRTIYDISLSFNYIFDKHWGLWCKFGYILNSSEKNTNKYFNAYYNNDFDIDKYYIIKNSFRYENESPDIRFDFGGLYKYNYKKWYYLTRIGFGIYSYSNMPTLDYTLKKINANDSYDFSYQWSTDKNKNKNYNDDGFTFISGELKAGYPISNRFSITAGVTYYQYLNKIYFKTTVADHYDKTIIREIVIKGKLANFAGGNIGITYNW